MALLNGSNSGKRARKNVLFLQSCYGFRESGCNFPHLLFVPRLMGRNELKPFIHIKRAEERMAPAILGEIAALSLFEKRQRSFAHFAQGSQHGLFFFERFGADRRRRF